MLTTAMFADFIGFILLALNIFFGIGEIIAWIPDILFTIVLGGWMYTRGGGGVNTTGRLSKFLKRRAPLMLAEYVPLVGTTLPLWTINVIMFLMQSADA